MVVDAEAVRKAQVGVALQQGVLDCLLRIDGMAINFPLYHLAITALGERSPRLFQNLAISSQHQLLL